MTVSPQQLRQAIASCLAELKREAEFGTAAAARIADRARQLDMARRNAEADRVRLGRELDGVTEAVGRTLALLGAATERPDPVQSARREAEPAADGYPLRGILASETIERAHRRLGALSEQARKTELALAAKRAQAEQLQALLAGLRADKRALEQQLAALARDNRELSRQRAAGERRERAAAAAHNRVRNDRFWSLCHFVGRDDRFVAYAARVGHDARRLFAFMLSQEIAATAELGDELKHAADQIFEIFDPVYYLGENPEMAQDGINPLLHYLTLGFAEGRRPNLLFDPDYYLEQAGAIRGNPVVHYATVGRHAGIKPHPLLDPGYYRARYPDLAHDGVEAIFHYQIWGGREGRDPSPLFDTEFYLERQDLPLLAETPLEDYLVRGAAAIDPHPLFAARFFAGAAGIAEFAEAPLAVYQKRRELWPTAAPHPLFDLGHLDERLAAAGEAVPEWMSPLEYFCRRGADSDLDPHILFDSRLYRHQVEIERGRSLAEPPVVDYLKRGWHDKSLLPNPLFDPHSYIERNGVMPDGPELVHYCLVGDRAGFYCHDMFCAGVYNAARTDAEPIAALAHFLRAPRASTIVGHPHMGRPLGLEPLEWVRAVAYDSGDIDPGFYRAGYPDLAAMSDDALIAHFCETGKAEGRYGSQRQMAQSLGLQLRDIPLGFFADEYLRFNPDLAALGDDFAPLFTHYLTIGRKENRSIGRWQFHLDLMPPAETVSAAAPLRLDRERARVEVCLLMHIFYDDLWPELAAYARNFAAVSHDAYVNIVDIAWTPRFQRELRELCPGAFVQMSNDNGRDIGGFIRLLDNVDFDRYELFALMHSKKSPHIAPEKGAHWRRELLNAFAGSPETVAECVAQFREDPTIGLIGCARWRETHHGDNAEHYRHLLDLFEIDEANRNVEYLSGTMCLIRGDILQALYRRLKQTQFEYGGDKDVEFHRDGQIAHGVERVIGNLARQMGYRILWR